MSTLDIRKPTSPTVTEIQYNDSGDRILADAGGVVLSALSKGGTQMRREVVAVPWAELEQFIQALRTGREMWEGKPLA